MFQWPMKQQCTVLCTLFSHFSTELSIFGSNGRIRNNSYTINDRYFFVLSCHSNQQNSVTWLDSNGNTSELENKPAGFYINSLMISSRRKQIH